MQTGNEQQPRISGHRGRAGTAMTAEVLEKDGKLATHGLRMKVVGGGCSGLRYDLSFD